MVHEEVVLMFYPVEFLYVDGYIHIKIGEDEDGNPVLLEDSLPPDHPKWCGPNFCEEWIDHFCREWAKHRGGTFNVPNRAE